MVRKSPSKAGKDSKIESLEAEIAELRRQVAELQAEKKDLEIALQTTTEHGDIIEAELEGANRRLQREIAHRELAQMTLQSMLEILTRDKADLESILETVTQHGDTVEIELYVRAAESTRRNEEQFRMIAEATPIAMILTNAANRIAYANPTTGTMLRTDARLLVDSTLDNFYVDRRELEKITQLLTSQGQVQDCEVRLKRCDGETFWANASIHPLVLQGEVVFLHTFYDINPLKESQAQLQAQAELLELKVQERTRELQQAKEAAELASRSRSEFLASMGHEIRTPLNAIMGFAQIMSLDDTLPDEYKDYLQMIYRSGEHLITLINDILEMSKIEAGKMFLKLNHFHLQEFLHVVKDLVILRAVDKGLLLVIELADGLPETICTDEGKLRQILLNLLSNAIKFTQQGQIKVRVEPVPPEHLRFQVSDTGVGIAPEELGKLFIPFVQTEAGRASGEGTGLGLTISRKYIELLGGDITVHSVKGVGTTFTFTIKIHT